MSIVGKLLARPIVPRVAGVVIGLVFVVAGLAKVGDPAAFASQIHNFRLAPIWSENLIAVCLPWIEIVAGVALLLGVRRRAGAWITAGLMIAFTVAVIQALLRGLDVDCGCFGTADASRVGLIKLVENAGLTALALFATLAPRAVREPRR